MKHKIIKIFSAAVILCGLAACEQDLPVYSDDTCRLNFYYDIANRAAFKPQLAKSSYSFIYESPDRMRDTLWYKVETMGKTSAVDRCIKLVQLDTTAVKAVPGKHYVAFDSPDVADYYVIKAGEAQAKIPVIILRDPSLKDETVTLKFGFAPNESFVNGYPEYQTRSLDITDHISKPSKWDEEYPFSTTMLSIGIIYGEWGPVKHQFLIDTTGEKWDDDFIDKLFYGDEAYFFYIYEKLVAELDKLNEKRAAEGLGPLSEADGTPVVLSSR